jgi:cytochrome c oxidase subunit 2
MYLKTKGPYSEGTIRLGITKGIDPAGEPLDEEIPRWNISQQDMDNLIEYLKTIN